MKQYRVKKWEDLKKQYANYYNEFTNEIEIDPVFVSDMKQYCGKVFEVIGENHISFVLKNAGGYFWGEWMLEPILENKQYLLEL